MRIIELKIGTTMKKANRWTKASATENVRIEQPLDRLVDEMGAREQRRLTSPLRPSSGIHEIMRITFEVQNGIVQTRNSTICIGRRADVEGEEIGDGEADDERQSARR